MVISIRAQRVNADLTQREVAERMGISEAKYSRLEATPDRMRLRELFKLAEVLGVDPLDIFAALDSATAGSGGEVA